MLDEGKLLDKIVRNNRGGFCYELNGAFAALLRAIGFHVKLLSAKVFHDDGRTVGPPMDHLALLVDDAWMADVGFGRLARHPIRFDSRRPQPDADGELLLTDAEHDDIDLLLDGKPQYRLEPRPRELADFAPTCWWQQTSPDSHFTRSLTCSLVTETGRVTLSGRRLISTEAGRRTERTLTTDAEVLRTYADTFGIELGSLPVEPRA